MIDFTGGRSDQPQSAQAVGVSAVQDVMRDPSSVRPGRVFLYSRTSTAWSKIGLAVLVSLIPARFLGLGGMGALTPGVVLAVLLLPVTGRTYRKFSWATLFLTLGALALASAPFLTQLSKQDHDVDVKTELSYIVDLVCALVTVITLLWSRLRLGDGLTAGSFACGVILNLLVTPSAWSTNAWKYAFAWPVAVLILSMLSRRNAPFTTIVALLMIGLISGVSDYRSFFGLCVLVAVVYAWGRFRVRGRRVSLVSTLTLVLIGVAIYKSAEWLALQGLLGDRNMVVTEAQISNSGSVIAGARIEPFAAIPLFLNRPWGYGPGVQPNDADFGIGVSGLTAAGIDASPTYVREFMFGDVLKLHSVMSDLWVSFGLLGLALGLFLGLWVCRGAFARFVAGNATGLALLLAFTAVWNLLFSPIISNLHEVLLAVALLAPLKDLPSRTFPP